MHAEPGRDLFLLAAMEWAAVRAANPGGGEAFQAAVRTLYRGAAACHVLFRAGKYAAVLDNLRAVSREVFGDHLPDHPPGREPDAASTLAASADLLHRQRLMMARRFPAALVPGSKSVA